MNNTDENGFVNGDPSRFFPRRDSTYVKQTRSKSLNSGSFFDFLLYSELLIILTAPTGKRMTFEKSFPILHGQNLLLVLFFNRNRTTNFGIDCP